MVIQMVQFFYTTLISHDFKFDRDNKLQGRSKLKEYIRFFGLVILTILNNVYQEPSFILKEAINVSNFVLGVMVLVEFFQSMHFITNKVI